MIGKFLILTLALVGNSTRTNYTFDGWDEA
jgi:hypothetical protein